MAKNAEIRPIIMRLTPTNVTPSALHKNASIQLPVFANGLPTVCRALLKKQEMPDFCLVSAEGLEPSTY